MKKIWIRLIRWKFRRGKLKKNMKELRMTMMTRKRKINGTMKDKLTIMILVKL